MTQKNITITIEGQNKSGKTTLAYFIRKVLENHGIVASYTDLEVRPTAGPDDDKIRSALKILSDRGLTVDIKEVFGSRR